MAVRNISGSRRSNAPLDVRRSWAWLADALNVKPQETVRLLKGEHHERVRRSLRNALERRGVPVETKINDKKTVIVVSRKAVA